MEKELQGGEGIWSCLAAGIGRANLKAVPPVHCAALFSHSLRPNVRKLTLDWPQRARLWPQRAALVLNQRVGLSPHCGEIIANGNANALLLERPLDLDLFPRVCHQ